MLRPKNLNFDDGFACALRKAFCEGGFPAERVLIAGGYYSRAAVTTLDRVPAAALLSRHG